MPVKSVAPRRAPGRPPKPKAPPVPTVVMPDGMDMLQFLTDVALGRIEANPLQVRAAIAAVQYTHTKREDAGKKAAVAEKAQELVEGGKFRPAEPPRLVVSNG